MENLVFCTYLLRRIITFDWMETVWENFRKRHPKFHKKIGITYILSVVISSTSGIYIGFFANGGWISASGFICLGLIWFCTTLKSFLEIKKNNIINHQNLMTYSYACTFAAVTLRLWFPLLKSLTGDPQISYLIVAWLCWIPNLIVAYFVNRSREVILKN